MNAIQWAYSWTQLANQGIYQTVLSKTTDEEKISVAETVILNKTSGAADVADIEAPIWWNFTIPWTTTSTWITLTITCPVEVWVEMYISWTWVLSWWEIWESCTTSKNIILTNWDWTKNVSMKWRDVSANETSVTSNSTIMTLIVDPCLASNHWNTSLQFFSATDWTWMCFVWADSDIMVKLQRTSYTNTYLGDWSNDYIESNYEYTINGGTTWISKTSVNIFERTYSAWSTDYWLNSNGGSDIWSVIYQWQISCEWSCTLSTVAEIRY